MSTLTVRRQRLNPNTIEVGPIRCRTLTRSKPFARNMSAQSAVVDS